jgi:hypothetical protein
MKLTLGDTRPQICLTIQPGSDNAGQPLDDFFDAFIGKRQLCASDRPLRDAAIALLDLGAPPDATLTARHLSWHRQITTTPASAAEGLDAGFDIAGVVLPFRRRGSVINRVINPRGGDAA